jgi:hypothetical protein
LQGGINQLKSNLAANPQIASDVWKNTDQLGYRHFFGGVVTGSGNLTAGENNLINYFENSRQFNNTPGAGEFYTNPGHDVNIEIENGDSEITRLELAIQFLNTEKQKKCCPK